MSGFPYPLSTESYPYDAAHLSYLQEYNTRAINTPGKEQNVSSKNDAFTLTFDALAFAVAVNFVNFKCCTIYSDYRKGLRKSKHVIVA